MARKPMTVMGVQYKARAPIDISKLKPALRKRLLEQRRVVPLEAAVLPGGAVSEVAEVTDTDLGAETTEESVQEAAPKAKGPKGRKKSSSRGS